jgi:hypothetical protein
MEHSTFNPNLTPTQVIQAGAFGGSYFGIQIDDSEDDYTQLFDILFQQVPTELYLSTKYSAKINKFGVRSGKDYRYWKDMKWIRHQDPRGWFQWYCNYSLGRRTSDDDRQIARWNDFCGMNGRWRNNIYSRIHNTGDWNISPRTQQSLLHWGYQVNEQDYQVWLSTETRTRNFYKTPNKLTRFNTI